MYSRSGNSSRLVHLKVKPLSDAGLKKAVVNLRALQFMNSSSIVLHSMTPREATWQRTMITAIRSFGGEHAVVQRGI